MPTPSTLARHSALSRVWLLALIAGTTSVAAIAQDGGGDSGKKDSPAAAPDKMDEGAKDGAKKMDGEAKQSDEQLAKDFVHYMLIERIDLVAATGQGLLDRAIPAEDFVKLIDRTGGEKRFMEAVLRAQRHAETEAIAAKLYRLYDDGKLASVRSPAQVTANIKLLTGDMQQRLFGQQRLKEAGEYAMPQLLQALMQTTDGRLQAEVRQLMVEMGKQSVAPLCVALPSLDPASQELVARILGDVGYPTSVPFLFQLRAKSASPEVQRAAEESIRKIVGVVNDQVSVAERFVDLAENYYAEGLSLTSFPGEQSQLWWNFDPGAGLVMGAVDTSVFHEAMAMRLCETALREDPTNARAISVWLAANFSREIDSPKDYQNPAYGPDRREAMYYAVAAGPVPSQQVLARGLKDNDTPLARKALAALEQTAGGTTLWAGSRGSEDRPLLAALRYPNRRVQYEAALALGSAGPREAFDGSDQVVRILGGAIRDASAKYALVISSNSERQAGIAEIFRSQGYTMLPSAIRLADVRQAIAEAPAVDIIVADLPSASAAELIAEAQSDSKLKATPILAIMTSQGFAEQSSKYSQDQRVRLVRDGASSKEVGEAARQLLEVATGGPITTEEADAYKGRSLGVLRDLAVSGNAILNVADAAGPLMSALPQSKGDSRMRIADVLSYVNSAPAQNALMDAAMASEGEERIMLLGKVANSAKRFGNQLEQRQIDALVELTKTGQGAEATAAAALMGALNLPNAELVPLIVGK